jgi:hypothetical protein
MYTFILGSTQCKNYALKRVQELRTEKRAIFQMTLFSYIYLNFRF